MSFNMWSSSHGKVQKYQWGHHLPYAVYHVQDFDCEQAHCMICVGGTIPEQSQQFPSPPLGTPEKPSPEML
eukprot:4258074-Karenia_brevis.AAC.1